MAHRVVFFLSLLLHMHVSDAQIVTEEVDFDYYLDTDNNDFTNHFDGGFGMSQIETGGITGGCLELPDSSSWGNDNAIYCSKYKPVTDDTVFTSICFKYDSALVHPNSFQRALSIFLRPQADFNHYIIASVSGNKKIELLTYSWNNNPYPPLILHTNHWYRYELMVIFSTIQQLKVIATVFDLGTTGTSTPIQVNSSSGTFTDEVLAMDTSIQVSITAARYGGATNLDNFHFEGRPGLTDCVNIATGIMQEMNDPAISVYPIPATDQLTIACKEFHTETIHATIYTLQGRIVKQFGIWSPETIVDIQKLSAGLYYLKLQSEKYAETISFAIHK
ncbi:MAG: T9SS type A sorting domain-containing protein [Chitinophagales bacterium]|nr:T9SS type A sorting domain-containing protein [Chitinophagales bacterium]